MCFKMFCGVDEQKTLFFTTFRARTGKKMLFTRFRGVDEQKTLFFTAFRARTGQKSLFFARFRGVDEQKTLFFTAFRARTGQKRQVLQCFFCVDEQKTLFFTMENCEKTDGADSVGGGGYLYKKVGWRRRRTSYGGDALIFVLLNPPRPCSRHISQFACADLFFVSNRLNVSPACDSQYS